MSITTNTADERHVYTDGGHRHSYGAGAWLVDHTLFASASFESSDAVYSEVMALVLALEALDDEHVVVHTDANQLAIRPSDLVARLRRLWDSSPTGLQLTHRLETAACGRDVSIQRTLSKGDEAVPQMRAVDALERFTRQVATLQGAALRVTADTLPITSADADPVLAAGWKLAAELLPDVVEVQERTCAPLGTSRANKILTLRGL